MSTKSIASVPLASAFNSSPGKQVEYTFNSKVMVAAMVILFIVVLFVVSLHIYAKWFWHQGTGATTRWSATHVLNASWQRRRRQLELGVEEDSLAVNTSTGLDPSTVNLLPTFVYEGAMLEAEPLLECSVCLSEFQVHDKGRVLPDCKHSFHIDCIDMWLHSHSTCPLCRTPILLSLAQAENTSNPGPAISQHNLSPATHQQHAEEQNTSAGESTDSQEQPPFLLNMAGLDSHPEEAGAANKAGHKVAMLHSFIPGASVMHARTPSYAEFLCKHDIGHANSMPWMGASGSTSATTMTTEILRQQERAAMARSTSLTLSRVLSEDERAWSSQPQKSSSFRISIKRLVSRELSKGRSRVFPAGRVNVESEQSTSMMHSPV